MRNISLSDFESRRLRSLDNCQVFCYDRQCLYACGKGVVIKKQGNNEEVICNLTENLYPVTDSDDIPTALDINYCSEKDLLHLILTNGDIISFDVNSVGSESIIGSVESGIEAAQWSPGQEVIAIVTGNDSVIVMTNDFDPVSEVDLHGGGFGEKQFMTVGWGKKETQFRGSEGKFNAKKKEEVGPLMDINNTIKISWRGDAEYFAVSSLNPETSQRYLRIFSKSGELQYTSENFNNLEHCLDWRPSGNLIASTQKLPNKYVVCFFEKNGLRHGEFTLPLNHNEIKVNEILWNKDSKILALLITKLSDDGSNIKYIQLYTVNNYHWYWKYKINFNSNVVPMIVQWDCLKYNTLHVIVKKQNDVYHHKYSWMWVTNKSRGNGLEDESFVAVINGCNLQLTSFKRGIVPPPMASYVLQLPASINLVSFAPDIGNTSSNDLLLQLSDGSVMVYKFDPKMMGHEFFGKIKKLGEDGEEELFYNVQWVGASVFMICCVKIHNGESKPFLSLLNIENWDSEIKFRKKEVSLHSTMAILRGCESCVVMYKNDGELYMFDNKTQSLSALYPGEKRTLIDLEIRDKAPDSPIIFSLDNLNKFYVNNRSVLGNVLSFHIHRSFVLITTMKHELLCVSIEKFELDDFANDVSDICKRRVERGSRLVTSVHKDMKVILQMPRGNLECVQPRALSLFVVGKYLEDLRFSEAFDLMRKQRINLNLIHDHDPVSFANNLNVFLDQIKDLQWISLFLSDLTEEDVTKTMYSVVYKSKGETKEEGKSKIDFVCDMVEKVLSRKDDPDRYFLPILTCHIKRGRIEDLETGLLKLKSLKERESSGSKPAVTFDEAFRYMLYLIDVEELYKIALGMYDFDLVLMIAGKSQKDPKEYLPFLNELKKLEPSYQRFTIDKHLKRYKKALTNLVLCDGDDVFNECISFIKAHQLYKFALKLIPQNTDRYKNVCICYGDELMRCHSYEEAGIMYSNAGMYRNAIEAYRKSGNWQEVISCGREFKMSENELSELYLDLAMELTEVKQFGDAATVYLDYLKDVEECVRVLGKGKLFAEAYRVSHLYQRSDLISAIIVPAITEQGNLTKLQISNFGETFTKQRKRLEVVRKQKQEALESKPDVDDDLYSESNTVVTQSNASRTTNRTYRSAKNKRKHERKLLSLKEGSPYEDLALVASLHNIATNCIELKPEVRELNKFLIKIKRYEMAEKLQNEFEAVLEEIEHSKSEIWTTELLTHRQSYGPDATSNEIASMYIRSESVAPVTLNPKFAIAPEPQTNVKWQLEILKP